MAHSQPYSHQIIMTKVSYKALVLTYKRYDHVFKELPEINLGTTSTRSRAPYQSIYLKPYRDSYFSKR